MKCIRCNSDKVKIITEPSFKGKDFKFSNACIGTICLYGIIGPFSLLCGLCGAGKQIENTTYWICDNCGKKWKAN